MSIIVIVHLCMLFVVESFSQIVVLDSPRSQTPCTKGLRHRLDTFSMNGSISEDYPLYVSAGFETKVSAEVLMRGFSEFLSICVIEIGENGESCNQLATESCYCSNYDNETGSVEFVMSQAADLSMSKAVVRVKWRHSNGNITYSHNNQTLPSIYDVNNATLVLKVNGEAVIESEGCSYNIILNADNQIELCCTNMASPCFPRVTVRQHVLQGDVPSCIRYQVMMHNAKLMSTMIKSYSVCSKDTYYMAGTCLAKSEQEEESGLPVLIFLIFGIPVAVIIYSAGRMVYIVFCQSRDAEGFAPDLPDFSDRVI